MPQFHKKPIAIEARQVTDETMGSVFNWITCNKLSAWDDLGNEVIKIQTPNGLKTAEIGDWVVKGEMGEFFPCKPDIFAAAYEPIEA